MSVPKLPHAPHGAPQSPMSGAHPPGGGPPGIIYVIIGLVFWFNHLKEEIHALLQEFHNVHTLTQFWHFVEHASLVGTLGLVVLACWIVYEICKHLPAYLMPVVHWFGRRLQGLRDLLARIMPAGKHPSESDVGHFKVIRAAIGHICPGKTDDYHSAKSAATRHLAYETGHVRLLTIDSPVDPTLVMVILLGSAAIGIHDEAVVKGLLEPHIGPLNFSSFHVS